MASGDATVKIYDGFFAPAATNVYDLGSASYIWDIAYINQLINLQKLIGKVDEITATAGGVAASVVTMNTEVTTDGGAAEDGVTLANGTSGQIKNIYCVVAGNAGDSYKITPATFAQGTKITFAADPTGKGCTLVYADSEGWIVVGNNGGTIA